MKKLIIFLAIGLFLAIPLAANADTLLGTGQMTLGSSGPTGGGYYLDYDGTVTSSNFGYTTPWVDVFCVSSDTLASGTFSFYSITTSLNLARSAYVADIYLSYIGTPGYPTQDDVKGEAQKAIWKIMGVMDIVDSDGLDKTLYDLAMAQSGTTNTHWYFAKDQQDFLTPVPEPGIMILLGIAMSAIGAASWRLRKL